MLKPWDLSVLPSLVILATLPTVSQAGIVYDTLSPTCCVGETIGQGGTFQQAIGFTAPQTFTLSSVSFALISTTASAGSLIVDIYNDNGVSIHVPTSLVATYSVPFPPVDPSSSVFTAQAPAGIVLNGGQMYWVTPRASDPSASAAWWYNLTVPGYRDVEIPGSNSWSPACPLENACGPGILAIQVTSVDTPEPSTFLLAGAVLAGGLIRRRARHAR